MIFPLLVTFWKNNYNSRRYVQKKNKRKQNKKPNPDRNHRFCLVIVVTDICIKVYCDEYFQQLLPLPGKQRQKGYYNRCFSDPPAEHDPFCDNIHSLHLPRVHILYLHLSWLLYSNVFGDFSKFTFLEWEPKRNCRHLNYTAIPVFKNFNPKHGNSPRINANKHRKPNQHRCFFSLNQQYSKLCSNLSSFSGLKFLVDLICPV